MSDAPLLSRRQPQAGRTRVGLPGLQPCRLRLHARPPASVLPGGQQPTAGTATATHSWQSNSNPQLAAQQQPPQLTEQQVRTCSSSSSRVSPLSDRLLISIVTNAWPSAFCPRSTLTTLPSPASAGGEEQGEPDSWVGRPCAPSWGWAARPCGLQAAAHCSGPRRMLARACKQQWQRQQQQERQQPAGPAWPCTCSRHRRQRRKQQLEHPPVAIISTMPLATSCSARDSGCSASSVGSSGAKRATACSRWEAGRAAGGVRSRAASPPPLLKCNPPKADHPSRSGHRNAAMSLRTSSALAHTPAPTCCS